MERNLSEIMSEIKEARLISIAKVEDYPMRSRAGIEMKIRQAQENLALLELEYKSAVLESFMVIAVSGEKSKEFADIAKAKGVVTVNYNKPVERIVAAIAANGGRETFTKQEAEMMIGELGRIRIDYSIAAMPSILNLNFVEYENVSVERAVKEVLVRGFGGISCVAVKCVDIGRNTSGEGDHLD